MDGTLSARSSVLARHLRRELLLEDVGADHAVVAHLEAAHLLRARIALEEEIADASSRPHVLDFEAHRGETGGEDPERHDPASRRGRHKGSLCGRAFPAGAGPALMTARSLALRARGFSSISRARGTSGFGGIQ